MIVAFAVPFSGHVGRPFHPTLGTELVDCVEFVSVFFHSLLSRVDNTNTIPDNEADFPRLI